MPAPEVRWQVTGSALAGYRVNHMPAGLVNTFLSVFGLSFLSA